METLGLLLQNEARRIHCDPQTKSPQSNTLLPRAPSPFVTGESTPTTRLNCTNQQPSQRGGAIPDTVWVGSKWLLDFPRVPVTPGTPLHFFAMLPPKRPQKGSLQLLQNRSPPVLSDYNGSPDTRFSRGTTRLMSWPDGERYLPPLQPLVVSLLLSLESTLLFSRT